MAKCDLCGKSVQFGNNVAHSNKKTHKMWKPNIKKRKVVVNGRTITRNICTRCIKTGKIIAAS